VVGAENKSTENSKAAEIIRKAWLAFKRDAFGSAMKFWSIRHLPIPTCWAQELIEDLEAALEQFREIAADLGVPVQRKEITHARLLRA
jgi:hypothetical protein